ncbi:MAG: tetratricopeptide (TPR) repeat protein [Crocinitomix sp.]|jgi:tetratricopeptide (TPR) repeat protein
MKLNAFMIALLLMLNGFSQDHSASSAINEEDCNKYKSLYWTYLMRGAYEDARGFWLKAYEVCGGTKNLDDGFFINGRLCYEALRDSVYTNDSIKRKRVSDSIPWIFEQNLIAAPSPLLNLKYAGYLIESESKDVLKIDELLLTVDSLNSETPARYLSLSFKHLILNHYNGATVEKKKLLEKEIFERYFVLNEFAEGAIVLNEFEEDENIQSTKLSQYLWAKDFLMKYMLLIVKDSALINQEMERQFDQLPVDPFIRVQRISEHLFLLEKLNAQSEPIYERFIYASLALDPSSNGYLGVGNMELNKGETAKAIVAYLKAIELSNSSEEQDDINLQLALAYYKLKDYRKAFNAARKVNGTNKGKALTICGNSVAATASSCGESTFDRKANYWLANDYYRKAANLGVDVSKSQFLELTPTNSDIFNSGLNIGDSYELPCWGEKTIIR